MLSLQEKHRRRKAEGWGAGTIRLVSEWVRNRGKKEGKDRAGGNKGNEEIRERS